MQNHRSPAQLFAEIPMHVLSKGASRATPGYPVVRIMGNARSPVSSCLSKIRGYPDGSAGTGSGDLLPIVGKGYRNPGE